MPRLVLPHIAPRKLHIEKRDAPVVLRQLDALLDPPDEIRVRDEVATENDDRVGVVLGGGDGGVGLEATGDEEGTGSPELVLRGVERGVSRRARGGAEAPKKLSEGEQNSKRTRKSRFSSLATSTSMVVIPAMRDSTAWM